MNSEQFEVEQCKERILFAQGDRHRKIQKKLHRGDISGALITARSYAKFISFLRRQLKAAQAAVSRRPPCMPIDIAAALASTRHQPPDETLLPPNLIVEVAIDPNSFTAHT